MRPKAYEGRSGEPNPSSMNPFFSGLDVGIFAPFESKSPTELNQSNLSMIQKLRTIYKKQIRKHGYLFQAILPKTKTDFDACFVIGANKTGTTSMTHFLRKCELKHLTINYNIKMRYYENDFDYLDWISSRFNSFDDIPWNRIDTVEHFMKKGVDNRFILTTRNPDEWFDSLVRFYKKLGREAPTETERLEIQQKYLLQHNEECRALAKTYNAPLLEIDITNEPNANERIVDFLGLNISPIPAMPHSNRTLEHRR